MKDWSEIWEEKAKSVLRGRSEPLKMSFNSNLELNVFNHQEIQGYIQNNKRSNVFGFKKIYLKKDTN